MYKKKDKIIFRLKRLKLKTATIKKSMFRDDSLGEYIVLRTKHFYALPSPFGLVKF